MVLFSVKALFWGDSNIALVICNTLIKKTIWDRFCCKKTAKPVFILVLLIAKLLAYQTAFAEMEYQLKAIMLGRLPSFVYWSASEANFAKQDRFELCVIGRSPLNTFLADLYQERTIKKKPVKVRYISAIEKIAGCHLLFISESKKREISSIVAMAKKNSVLTVGETKGFAERGVIIKFYSVQKKIKFEINNQAAKDSGLTISSQLLTMSKIINPVK